MAAAGAGGAGAGVGTVVGSAGGGTGSVKASVLVERALCCDGSDDNMAAMPDMDHLTPAHFREFYEPSDDTFLFLDCLLAERPSLETLAPTLCVELG